MNTLPITSVKAEHPILHPDILPLVLSFASDATLAHLMRVSRHLLAEIVNLRWPVITFDPSNRRTVLRSRTSLPDHPHRFSAAMQTLLTQYARMAIILPHAAYSCPPRAILRSPSPIAQTVQIDRRGLCRSDTVSPIPSTHDEPGGQASAPCELFRRFSPTTIRIDGIIQYPIFPLPHGLRFPESVTRLLLCIEPATHAHPIPTDTLYLHQFIGKQITEVVFLLAQPTSDRDRESFRKDPRVSLLALSEAIVKWLIADEGRQMKWTVIGAERLRGRWVPKPGVGALHTDGETALREGLTRAAKGTQLGLQVADRVEFVTLKAYLGSVQTRSELTMEEINVMSEAERMRTKTDRKKTN